jgi:hypothetical protein
MPNGPRLPVECSRGVAAIERERLHQVDNLRFDADHDDAHEIEQLAKAAACYALPHRYRITEVTVPATGDWQLRKLIWPWQERDWKPETQNLSPPSRADGIKVVNRIAELSKAGALIAAEIDRLARMHFHREER